jgi:uncharacterized repeat protein (TIGR01451 family)
MRRNVLSVVGLTMLLAAGLAAALIGFAASPARAGGSVCSDATHTCTWDGNGTNAASCQNITAGTGILWIFTGAATPTDLVVTWSNGETDVITGWVQQGDGSWHLQTNLVGSFPPTSAFVDFTGTNGSAGATLTISGCNEGGPPGTTTTVTTPTTTTTTTVPTTTTMPGATIGIVKTADAAQVDAGDAIGFTLTVFNTGETDALGVKLSDTLPTNAGLSWSIDAQGTGWSNTCAIDSGVLSCGGADGVTVPAGTSQGASTFTVHITSPTTADTGGDCPHGSGVVNNTGDVTASNADSAEASASTCVAAAAQGNVDLSVTKTGSPATQDLGQGNITWTIVVTNNGPATDTGVTITDPLPAGNTFVSATSTQGTCTGGSVPSCDIGTMAAGATVTITLVTTPSTTGAQTNTVTVTGNHGETNTANNTASATVQVTAPLTPPKVFCVAVSRVSPKQLFVGRKTTLTIHVTRHGKAVKGIRVRIKGPKINARTKPSNAKGVIKRVVKIRKAGVLVFSPIASKRCNTKRVGVTGVFTPPVTG